MKNMAHDISLDHLKEEEVAMILKVLERDAQIQKKEDARRQKLRDSIKFERIPGKRLSVKLRTGDWVNEITDPSRQKEKRGTDIVRASIRQKKWKKAEDTLDKVGEDSDAERLHPSKPDVVIDADKLNNFDPAKSPARKPSIRRKQVAKAPGKQVTFNDNKTEKIIFNDARTTAEESPNPDASEQQEVTVSVASHEDVARNSQSQHDDNNAPSDTNFQRYHDSYAFGTSELKSDVQQEDKLDKEKTTKKVRVIKRKGSSRRKPISKITDDSDRDNLFRAPEHEENEDLIENTSSESASAVNVQDAKASSISYGIDPDCAINSPPAAVSDYSVDDSIQIEEIISIATTAVYEAWKPAQVLEAIDPPQHFDEDQELFKSKQENLSHHTAEVPFTSVEPRGGDHESRGSPFCDFSTEAASNPQDEGSHHSHIAELPDGENDSSNTLGVAQDYADVTLKPNDLPQMLAPVANEASPDFDADDDGGRTPTVEKAQNLDGMELLKEIEAVLPQVNAERTDNSSENYQMDQYSETYDTNQPTEIAENKDTEGDEVKQVVKPKKKVIKVIKKSKRDKSNGKTDSPEHNSQEGLDDEARMLIDEVTNSMNAPSNGQQAPGRKKVVKKIIKKKKADDSHADDQSASPKKDDENPCEEGNADGDFGLGRRKTVRRKVSKRQPPPPPPE